MLLLRCLSAALLASLLLPCCAAPPPSSGPALSGALGRGAHVTSRSGDAPAWSVTLRDDDLLLTWGAATAELRGALPAGATALAYTWDPATDGWTFDTGLGRVRWRGAALDVAGRACALDPARPLVLGAGG